MTNLGPAYYEYGLTAGREGGRNLRSASVLARYGVSASTMHKALKALDNRGLVLEEALGSIHYRLEDPFFAYWLRMVQV